MLTLFVAVFGGIVLYHHAKQRIEERSKSEPRWSDGICLGDAWPSNGYIFGTTQGVTKARSIRRLTEDECRDSRAIREIQGAQWKPNPNTSGSRISAHVSGTNEDAHHEAALDEDISPAFNDDDLEEDVTQVKEETRSNEK